MKIQDENKQRQIRTRGTALPDLLDLSLLPACYVVKHVSDFVPVFWLTTKTFEIFTEINVILYNDFRREAVHRENQGRIRLRSVFPASTELNIVNDLINLAYLLKLHKTKRRGLSQLHTTDNIEV